MRPGAPWRWYWPASAAGGTVHQMAVSWGCLLRSNLPERCRSFAYLPRCRQVRKRFEAGGGVVLEFASAAGVTVHPDGVALAVPGCRGASQPPPAERSRGPAGSPGSAEPATTSGAGPEAGPRAGKAAWGPGGSAAGAAVPRGSRTGAQTRGADAESATSDGAGPGLRDQQGVVTARLLVDSTGNFGPMVRQARWGARPDGVCLVVGACCRGFPSNTTGARR